MDILDTATSVAAPRSRLTGHRSSALTLGGGEMYRKCRTASMRYYESPALEPAARMPALSPHSAHREQL